jgi:c-di-GMP-binding flagellar brake protein YcgR
MRRKLGYSGVPVEIHFTSTKQLQTGIAVSISKDKDGKAAKAAIVTVNEQYWTIKGEESVLSKIKAGDSLHVWFIRRRDAEYSLRTEVMKNLKDQIVLKHTLNLKRKQLRNWVRVMVNIPCEATFVGRDEDESADLPDNEIAEGTTIYGRIMDISGGGMSLRLKTPLQAGSRLLLNFELPGYSIKNIQVGVIGSEAIEGIDAKSFLHRIKFQDIETSMQEKIVRFVFEKQKEDTRFR